MADRFWVLNGGNSNDTGHWSASTGGASGATAPASSSDNASWDGNSFSLAGQTVTVNASLNCLDMNWTGATNTPTFTGANLVFIYGSATFIAAMLSTYSGTMGFQSTASGKTITTNGVNFVNHFSFGGAGGVWTLQDALTTSLDVTVNNGTLNTNGKTVSSRNFIGSGATTRAVNLGASAINLTGDWTFTTTTSLTFTAGTSVITLSGTTKTFNGGGLTYNSVKLTGTPITIAGSNTIGILTLTAGKTAKFTAGTTQTLTRLIAAGTVANPISIQSASSGSAATISVASGIVILQHCNIKDMTFIGGATFYSVGGTDQGGNTGITFLTKLEVGRIKISDGSFNWINSSGVVTKVSG